MPEGPQHKFADKLFRKVLGDPRNIADLVKATLPEIAETLDFTKVDYLNRTGLHADPAAPHSELKERELDVLVLTALRDGSGEILCCILVEQQSKADAAMPLRILEYSLQAWSQAWANRPGRKRCIHGILPIVLYTGHRPWRTHRQLEDIISAPNPLMCPYWPITYFCLEEFDPATLTSAPEPFINALSIVRVEKSSDLNLLVSTVKRAVRRIAVLSPDVHDRFIELMDFVIRWIHGRLPRASHQELLKASYSEIRYSDQEDIMTMTNKLGLTWQEEIIIARKESRSEGRDIGKREALRETLLNLLEARFGQLPDALRQQIGNCSDLDALQEACIKVLAANSPADVEL